MVFPGGKKFVVLINAPYTMYQEGFIKTIMDNKWNANSTLAVPFNTQVVLPVRRKFLGYSDSTGSILMIIYL